MKKLLTGEPLRKQAKSLGVSTGTSQMVTIPEQGTTSLIADDYEIQRRVIEAERHIREHNFWVIAVISAAASLISALAAWVAVLK